MAETKNSWRHHFRNFGDLSATVSFRSICLFIPSDNRAFVACSPTAPLFRILALEASILPVSETRVDLETVLSATTGTRLPPTRRFGRADFLFLEPVGEACQFLARECGPPAFSAGLLFLNASKRDSRLPLSLSLFAAVLLRFWLTRLLEIFRLAASSVFISSSASVEAAESGSFSSTVSSPSRVSASSLLATSVESDSALRRVRRTVRPERVTVLALRLGVFRFARFWACTSCCRRARALSFRF
mmetsp:Transcript_30753/g.74980  ORF Transcript_30753/g.74980 Transcript_30753/m.74980 type:complete len:245 (-) Transcript_30753:192-926(-)